MPYLRFLPFSVCGGIGWVLLMTTAGYYLGRVTFVQKHFELVIIAIVAISLIPTLIEANKARKKSAVKASEQPVRSVSEVD